MQVERRRPPLKMKQSELEKMLKEYLVSVARNEPPPATLQRQIDYPNRVNASSKNLDPKSLATYYDTKENPIVKQMAAFKKTAEEKNRIAYDYFLTSPLNVDQEIVFEKAVTYFLNEKHTAAIEFTKDGKIIRKSDGSAKAALFVKLTKFKNNDALSVNSLFNWLVEEIFDYEKTLFEVKYTSYGIQNTYLTAFMTLTSKNEKKLMYLRHVWQGSYQNLSEADIKVLEKENRLPENFIPGEPVLDGFSKLVTGLIRPFQKLNAKEKDFVTRRYLDKSLAVQETFLPPQDVADTSKADWQIDNMKELLKHSENWLDALPGVGRVDFSEKSLFVKNPLSFYKFNSEFYPSANNNLRSVRLLPIGEWYGFLKRVTGLS